MASVAVTAHDTHPRAEQMAVIHRIFRTAFMQDEREARARQNMQRELAELTATLRD